MVRLARTLSIVLHMSVQEYLDDGGPVDVIDLGLWSQDDGPGQQRSNAGSTSNNCLLRCHGPAQ